MKPRPATSSPSSGRRAKRAARLVLIALAVGAAGIAVVQTSNSPSSSPNEEATGPGRDRSRIPHSSPGRRSGGLRISPPPSSTTSSAPGALPTASPWPGSVSGPVSPRPTGGVTQNPLPGTGPQRGPGNGTPDQGSGAGSGTWPGGSGSATGGYRPAPHTPPSAPARPIGTPSTTVTPPLTVPARPDQRPTGPTSPVTPIPLGTTTHVTTTTTTQVTTTTTTPPPEPDRDEVNCPNLDLIAIGGVSAEAPAVLQALAPRFRELAAAELAKPLLVCAKPLEFWRDLVIQRLVTAGQSDGALITATDGSSVVLRISEIDWTGYRLRFSGSPIGVNFLGYPVGYITMGETTILRTTLGGLVSSRPDTIGIAVMGGAWDFWMAQGGPDGPMGTVTGQPQAAYGPFGGATPEEVAKKTVTVSGASQDFANGWIFLPGVASDVEAAAQPAARYEWHHESDYLGAPTDGLGHILQTDGMAYYVDPGGVRHWLRTTSAWSCARWNLGATEIKVRGFEMADYVVGSQFVCPN